MVAISEMSIAGGFYLSFSLPKLVLFRRCSGYSSGEECKFSLLLDVVESEVWGGGLVTILHTCQATRNIRQDCQHDNNQVGPWSSGAVEKSPP